MVAAKVYKRNEQGRKKSAAILAGMPPSPVDAAGVSLKSFFYTQCIQCGPPVRARRYRRSIAISRCESEKKEGGKNYWDNGTMFSFCFRVLNAIVYSTSFEEKDALVILESFSDHPAASQTALQFVEENWKNITKR